MARSRPKRLIDGTTKSYPLAKKSKGIGISVKYLDLSKLNEDAPTQPLDEEVDPVYSTIFERLRSEKSSRPVALNFAGTNVGSIATVLMVTAFIQTHQLLELNLSHSNILTQDAKNDSLIPTLAKHSTLQKLTLANCRISLQQIELFCRLLMRNEELLHLDISHSDFSWALSTACEFFVTMLSVNHILRTLNLSHCGELETEDTDNGDFLLSRMLPVDNTAMTCLDLSDNSIDSDDFVELAKGLEANTTLTKLSLNNNHIHAESLDPLAKSLKSNTALTDLDLANNPIEDKGVSLLFKSLFSNRTLRKLDISFENARNYRLNLLLEVRTLSLLVQLLTTNHTLLDVKTSPVKEVAYDYTNVKTSLAHNRTLAEMTERNWQRIAILIAFIRANYGSPLAMSIFPLLNPIANAAKEERTYSSSVMRF